MPGHKGSKAPNRVYMYIELSKYKFHYPLETKGLSWDQAIKTIKIFCGLIVIITIIIIIIIIIIISYFYSAIYTYRSVALHITVQVSTKY